MKWWYENEEEKMEDKELDERIKEMGVELKPCPFCGGEPEAWVDKRDSVPVYYIECAHNIGYKCGVSLITVPVASLERAVELWNTRATEQKAEKKYRPFKDTDELIKVWCEKGGKWQKRELTMPLIWVQIKDKFKSRELITGFDTLAVSIGIEGNSMGDLFREYTFLDGSPCGVEE